MRLRVFSSSLVAALVAACLIGVLTLPAYGQFQTSTAASSSKMVTPGSKLPTGFQPTPQFVNGKVIMDDGTLPPDSVPIEMLCSGIAHTEGHTDVRGAFGLELGRGQLVQDATYTGTATTNPNRNVPSDDPGADPNRPYRECELRANLPGYRSDSILLASFRPGENGNLGSLMLHKMGNVEGSVISATSAAAPRNATREYEKGLESVKRGKIDEAVQSFNAALAAYPDFSAAWFELGKLQLQMQQLLDAQKSFEAAIKAEPKFLSPYVPLSQLAFKAKNWPMLADVTDRLVKLDAFDFPQEYYYNGLANYTLQRLEPAEKSLRAAIKLDSQNRLPAAHQFMAAILVKKNELPAAIDELRSYLKLSPAAADAEQVRYQLTQLEKVTSASASSVK